MTSPDPPSTPTPLQARVRQPWYIRAETLVFISITGFTALTALCALVFVVALGRNLLMAFAVLAVYGIVFQTSRCLIMRLAQQHGQRASAGRVDGGGAPGGGVRRRS